METRKTIEFNFFAVRRQVERLKEKGYSEEEIAIVQVHHHMEARPMKEKS